MGGLDWSCHSLEKPNSMLPLNTTCYIPKQSSCISIGTSQGVLFAILTTLCLFTSMQTYIHGPFATVLVQLNHPHQPVPTCRSSFALAPRRTSLARHPCHQFTRPQEANTDASQNMLGRHRRRPARSYSRVDCQAELCSSRRHRIQCYWGAGTVAA